MTTRASSGRAAIDPRAGLPRSVEVIAGLLGLVLLAPLFLLIAVLVRLGSPGPALFRQERVGRDRRPFQLVKFRTMVDREARDAGNDKETGPLVTAASDPRITRVGALLRRSKLDELPQLLNVIRGDLSLVGPRPEVPHYVDGASPQIHELFERTLLVRPGLVDPTSLLLFDEQGLLSLAGSTDDERDHFYREQLLPFKLREAIAYLERRTAFSDLGLIVRTITRILLPRSRDEESLEDLLQRVRGGL